MAAITITFGVPLNVSCQVGDTAYFVETSTDGGFNINNNQVTKTKIKIDNKKIYCGNNSFETVAFEETLSNGIKYIAVYRKNGRYQNSDKFIVPDDHYFFLGDNRDCSKDSRYLSSVGYVNKLNLVGKAQIIFFSNDTKKSSLLKFWNLFESFRSERLLKIL